MLDAMRRTAGTWVVRILFGILILSFAAWGIGDMFRTRGVPDNVAEVGDVSVSRDELARQYRREIERLQRVMGPEFDSERAREMGLLQRTLDSLVDGHLLGQKAHDMHLVASDNLVRSRIYAEPAFQGPARQFDANTFRRALAEVGLTEPMYVATLRAGLIRGQLTDAIASGAEAPGVLRDAIYRFRGERRVAEYLRIPNSTVGQIPEPTQDDLAAFHAKNQAMFTAPEQRELTVISLDPDAVTDGFQPTEDQIKQAYDERLPSISIPERRRVRHMLFADEAGAKKAEELLAQGKTFDAVAKEAPGQLSPDTSLGLVARGDLPPALAETAFSLAEGKASAPVKDPLGWHILTVDKIEGGTTPPLDSVRAEIVRDLARDAAVGSLVKTANKLEDELAGGASLEQAADKLGLKAVTVGPIDSKGRLKGGTPATNLPNDPKFLEFAFRIPQGQTSQLQEARNGGYFILRVDKSTPPALRPLDEVRAQVAAAWTDREREDAARKRADALLQRVKGGEALSKIAAELHLEAKTSEPLSRFSVDSNSSVPPPLVSELFKAHTEEVVMASYEGGFAIGRLKEIKPVTPSDASADAAQMSRELTLAVAQDLLSQYTAALRRTYPVTINRAAVDSIQ
jgi:peptidyl-prolyl cis-trans isomerase D